MKNILFAALTLFAFASQAHDNHTPNYCNDAKTHCVHLGYDRAPVVGEAHEFVVDLVMPKETLDQVQDVKVELWMPSMGHGSAPVTISKLDLNHFQITDAYFVMPGDWVVKVQVVSPAQTFAFEIPFAVK